MNLTIKTNMSKLNLPPFYVGQKVVYITGDCMPKNSIHVIKRVLRCNCGEYIIDVGRTKHLSINTCSNSCCAIETSKSQLFKNSSFRPLEEAPAPLLTFEQIKQTEKEEILTLN